MIVTVTAPSRVRFAKSGTGVLSRVGKVTVYDRVAGASSARSQQATSSALAEGSNVTFPSSETTATAVQEMVCIAGRRRVVPSPSEWCLVCVMGCSPRNWAAAAGDACEREVHEAERSDS
jgi:hypothetical protein